MNNTDNGYLQRDTVMASNGASTLQGASNDTMGQVIFGKRFWSDGTPVAGQQFTYLEDSIGNRTAAANGGDASGQNLRSWAYTPNRLNQYTNRTVPAAVDVLGIANPTAAVTVNGNTAYRHGEYFDYVLPVANGTGQYATVSVFRGTLRGCI